MVVNNETSELYTIRLSFGSDVETSKIVKFIEDAYTAPKVNKAEWIIPVQNILTDARGEVLYKLFIFM